MGGLVRNVVVAEVAGSLDRLLLNRCNEKEAAREEPSVAYPPLLFAGASAAHLAFCGFRTLGGLGGLEFGHDKGLDGTAAASTAAAAAAAAVTCEYGRNTAWTRYGRTQQLPGAARRRSHRTVSANQGKTNSNKRSTLRE